MKPRLPSLSALRAFEAAARLKSFKLAAEALSVSPTAISHQIRALEDSLSCALFVRQTRKVDLSAEGELLYAATKEGFDCIAAGVERLRVRQRSTVTLSATPAFTAKWLVPRMAAFQAAHPEIDLHIHASNQQVDLHSGAVDLAIRYGQGSYHDLLATRLLQDHFAPVASKLLHIRQLSDLSLHPLIHFDWHSPPPMHLTWAGWLQNAGISDLDSTAGIRYSEESHAIQAALAGQGVALLSLELVKEEIAMGLLEVPLTPIVEGLAYHLVRSALKPAAAAVTIVEKWLIQAASKTAL
ncbi:LysR substrate-binding domain-containing protein [Janthinobacterium sp. B9-8]|uniref:LysR substrate-binding domain-containing protein n=1 Tax=Janthinobacterium sp. B9-8 TaxID=1236179 RepID=UPI00061CF564|nr:LysR substrate-binding domain-containing protein [Janthinobacterium sp. B9-8]AMC33587.1 transcriptional regulator [Janthinobacterium sp. B9-8]